MSDAPQGEGWWQASDGRWYPPEQHPSAAPPAPPPTPPPPPAPAPPPAGPAPPAPGWWQASDGKWYPPEQHPSATPPAPPPAPTPPPAPPPPPTQPPTPTTPAAPPTTPEVAPTGRETIFTQPTPAAWSPAGGAPHATPAERKRGGRAGKVVLGIIVALALIAGAFAIVTQLSDDEASAGPVLVERLGTEGPDPFTAAVAPTPSGSLQDYAARGAPGAPDVALAATDRSGDYPAVKGGEPGLYGGSRNDASCDVPQLVSFLEDEDDKARAWAGALGIDVAEIRGYIDGLTPVYLGADTRVRNHGFANGRATPRDVVLQRGSAVLVDKRGMPRVRCFCGNPLIEPAVTAGESYTGTEWAAFEPERVLVIEEAASDIAHFQLVDIETGALFTRPTGTKGEADSDELIDIPVDPGTTTTRPGEAELAGGVVQVTLRWSSSADLDLAVTSPLGERVDFGSRSVPSGGELDVDANSACTEASSAPVENIVWSDRAPPGEYLVEVTLFDSCDEGSAPQNFELSVMIGGRAIPLEGGGRGSVSEGQPVSYRFTVSG